MPNNNKSEINQKEIETFNNMIKDIDMEAMVAELTDEEIENITKDIINDN